MELNQPCPCPRTPHGAAAAPQDKRLPPEVSRENWQDSLLPMFASSSIVKRVRAPCTVFTYLNDPSHARSASCMALCGPRRPFSPQPPSAGARALLERPKPCSFRPALHLPPPPLRPPAIFLSYLYQYRTSRLRSGHHSEPVSPEFTDRQRAGKLGDPEKAGQLSENSAETYGRHRCHSRSGG